MIKCLVKLKYIEEYYQICEKLNSRKITERKSWNFYSRIHQRANKNIFKARNRFGERIKMFLKVESTPGSK